MTDQTTTPDEPRQFAAFLLEQNRGQTHAELSQALHDLVARVTDTGKKGTLTLQIVVEPLKGAEEALRVSDVIKLALPEHKRNASIFFRGRDGNLQREDPNQISLFGDDVRDAPAAPTVQPTVQQTAPRQI